jgi:hypothetical protein
MRAGRTFRSLTLAIVIALGLLCTSRMLARDAEEPVLAAAYIYNITQFTSWPDDALAASEFVVCTNGDSSLASELGKLAGKPVKGRAWVAVPLAASRNPAKCNVIVLEKDTLISRALADVLASDRPVLVITNADIGKRPWAVKLFAEDNHIRFDIDRSEAGRRHLSLSSRLLSLARSVI